MPRSAPAELIEPRPVALGTDHHASESGRTRASDRSRVRSVAAGRPTTRLAVEVQCAVDLRRPQGGRRCAASWRPDSDAAPGRFTSQSACCSGCRQAVATAQPHEVDLAQRLRTAARYRAIGNVRSCADAESRVCRSSATAQVAGRRRQPLLDGRGEQPARRDAVSQNVAAARTSASGSAFDRPAGHRPAPVSHRRGAGRTGTGQPARRRVPAGASDVHRFCAPTRDAAQLGGGERGEQRPRTGVDARDLARAVPG